MTRRVSIDVGFRAKSVQLAGLGKTLAGLMPISEVRPQVFGPELLVYINLINTSGNLKFRGDGTDLG